MCYNFGMVPLIQHLDIVDNQTAAILRGKTEAERLAIAHRMWSSASRTIRSVMRSEHPDWTDDRIQLGTARRLSHGAV
jgi:hypothetical protein